MIPTRMPIVAKVPIVTFGLAQCNPPYYRNIVMRIHFSSAVTIFVTLLFISGTVGCRSNGGPWYHPKSYAFTNPFAKDNQAPPYSPSTQANTKPSLDSHPNISNPPGGFSDESSLYANRSGSYNGTSSASSSDHGGYPSPVTVASQGTSNPYGGYSIAEPSPYPPTYAGGQPSATNAAAHQYQYQYPSEATQPGNPMPYNYNEYPAGTQYQATSAVSYPPTTLNSTSPDNYGSTNPAMGNYAPFGAPSQNDPYTAAIQSQSQPPAPPAGSYYNQPATPAPYHTSEGVPAGTPYQPYQPSSGYSY
jgi:hypothetical protein